MPDWNKVKVPLLSTANWGGQGLHPRGNFEGFVRSASEHKWLEVHGIEHWTHFYTNYGLDLQKRFFGRFLKGDDSGWAKQPKVQLQVRHPGEKFVERHENEWPLTRTQWTKLYIHPADLTMSAAPPTSESSVTYAGLSDGVTFLTEPLEHDTEITGPIAAKLWVSSATEDADLFLVVRAFTPDLKEVTFQGALDAHTPIAQGWLRCSHRKLDPKLTLPYRPYHTHDEEQKLTPGQVYEVDVEVWPTCIVLPKGYRLALSVRGTDYVFPGEPGEGLETLGKVWTGCAVFTHDDPRDRPPAVFGGDVTLHAGPDRQAYVLLPVIPKKVKRRSTNSPMLQEIFGEDVMSYREVSEVRDGMRIDWDMPITMDDGLGAALRRVPADQERPLPGAAQPRSLRQVAALRRRLQDRLEAHGARSSRT